MIATRKEQKMDRFPGYNADFAGLTRRHEVKSCCCCGNVLEQGRKLICASCLDPNGVVAMTSRMLRGTGKGARPNLLRVGRGG